MASEQSLKATGFPLMEELTVLEIRSYLEQHRSILMPVELPSSMVTTCHSALIRSSPLAGV